MKDKSANMKLTNIFRWMMEEGYYPDYEQKYIQFDIDDNTAVVEYDEDIISVRLFFTIEEEAYDMFLEASNSTMLETYAVKSAVLDNMTHLMFSCEFMCDNLRDFQRFFPRAVNRIKEALAAHKSEMKKLILASEVVSATIPATDESMTGIDIRQKMLS